MKKIEFFQLNTAKRLTAMAELDKDDVIYLIQEPNLDRRGKGSVPSKKDFYATQGGRAAIYAPNLTSTTFSVMSDFTKKDLVAGVIENAGLKKATVIASIYLDGNGSVELQDWVNLIRFCRSRSLPLLCGMDANAWSHLWGCNEENRRGEELERFLIQERAKIHNSGTTPTFYRKRRGEEAQMSIIDITVSFNLKDKIKEWKVNEKSMNSDHRPIEYFLEGTHAGKRMMRNFRNADWGKFKAGVKSRRLEGNINNKEDIERQ